MHERLIKPIAIIKTDFTDKFGIPRQSGRAPSLIGKIIFEKEFKNGECLKSIEEFSHLWLIFGFSEAIKDSFSPTVRPPRLGGNKKVGVFASRSPFRPNSLGLSSVKLEKIEKTEVGIVLTVSGADLLDGTPIYDIKPYLPFTDCHADAKGGYADNAANYKLNVVISDEFSKLLGDKLTPLIECLEDDPRPSYQEDGREYGMSFAGFEIKFKVSGKTLTILSVIKSNQAKNSVTN